MKLAIRSSPVCGSVRASRGPEAECRVWARVSTRTAIQSNIKDGSGGKHGSLLSALISDALLFE